MNWILALGVGMMILSSCERPMTLGTKVYEDGTFDKTIVFEKADSSLVQQNVFGINAQHGWSTSVEERSKQKKDNKDRFHITFNKHFNSIEEMNVELNSSSDTLFQIKSTFERKFKWFYTYIRYTETFTPINRFKMLPITDYINKEDFQFIERLPSEGSSISKADSVFLQTLNEKIVDQYANMAIFNEQYDILIRLLKKNNMEEGWFDTLARKRDYIYNHIDKMKGDPSLAMEMADSLQIPLPREKAKKDAAELSKDFNSRLSFMGFAKDGKYRNAIDMPWQVVETNADSVSGNKLFWHPVATKFLITNYVMYAESRKLNIWTLVVSAIFLVATAFVLLRKR
ncbi:MAG: hypothetical protein ABI663_02820 [Chryseolinea sp.]